MEYKKALRAAFPRTIPVLTGYLFIGIAFGILAQSKGYHFLWAGLMGVMIYAGAMQFVTVDLLAVGVHPLSAALVTLMVNARHIFYGLSMLDKFKGLGAKKPYMIYSLSDETFSLLCGDPPPLGVDQGKFYLCMALLDQSYWVVGSMIGGLLGAALTFNTQGIDFVMTALFVVTFTDHMRAQENRIPAMTGLLGSLLCLMIFGPDSFILPAMAVLVIALTALRAPLERRAAA